MAFKFTKPHCVQTWNLYYRNELRKKIVAAVIESYQPEKVPERRSLHIK